MNLLISAITDFFVRCKASLVEPRLDRKLTHGIRCSEYFLREI